MERPNRPIAREQIDGVVKRTCDAMTAALREWETLRQQLPQRPSDLDQRGRFRPDAAACGAGRILAQRAHDLSEQVPQLADDEDFVAATNGAAEVLQLGSDGSGLGIGARELVISAVKKGRAIVGEGCHDQEVGERAGQVPANLQSG
jgi:hypothetical protein